MGIPNESGLGLTSYKFLLYFSPVVRNIYINLCNPPSLRVFILCMVLTSQENKMQHIVITTNDNADTPFSALSISLTVKNLCPSCALLYICYSLVLITDHAIPT